MKPRRFPRKPIKCPHVSGAHVESGRFVRVGEHGPEMWTPTYTIAIHPGPSVAAIRSLLDELRKKRDE